MASQEESPIRGLATSWPALAAMAVTVLSFLLASPRLESPRPTGIGSGSKQELRTPDVPARLWQDPRTCVMQGQCQTSLDLIVKGLPPKNGDPNNVLVLLVLCEADLNPEAMENRRRERYATLAALNTAGYVPVKSERLSYVDLDLDPKADASAKHAKEGAPARNQDAKEDSACKERVRVPFEWAQPQEKSAQTGDSPKKREFRGVCVVWLYFDVDLKNLVYSLGFLKQSLGCALSCALTDGGECQFAITGRITSNMLQRIFDDDGRLEKHRHGRLEKVTLYVTYSTAKDVRHDKSHAGVKSSGASPHGPKLKVTTNSGLNLEYIIGHDEQLLHSLVGELHNRGVSGHTDQIAVISEWDTLYGRAMHKGFLDALKKQYGQSETKEEGPQEKKGSGMGDGMGGGHGGAMGGGRGDGMGGRRGDGAGGGRGPDREFRNVHLFSFLRGLDGKLPGVKTESPAGDDKEAGPARPADVSTSKPSALEGEGDAQIDYLRRLVGRMKAKHKPFKAIGVLGTDVYDKLLILQALRPSFPGAVFFTTDLDARLLQPEESAWTHNLIIASHFGLILDKELQGTIPPFRSGYDAATYLGCLRAVKYKINGVVPELAKEENAENAAYAARLVADSTKTPFPVHLYEVCRSGAFELTIYNRHEDPVGERNYRRDAGYFSQCWWWWVPVVFGCTALLGFLLWTVSRTWQRILSEVFSSLACKKWPTAQVSIILGGLLLAVILAFLIGYAHYQSNEEPFSMVERVSVWPTNVFRLFAVVLCCYYVFRAVADLADRNRRIREDFDLPAAAASPPEPPRRWLPRLWTSLCSCADMWRWSPREGDVGTTWQRFEEYGSTRNRFLRCTLVFVLNLILLLLLFTLLEFPMHQSRGPLARWITIIALCLSGAGFIALLVFVVDATVLCNRFVSYLARYAGGWSPTLLEKHVRERGLPPEATADDPARKALDQWLVIRLIADSTEVVAHFIYYPFVVLLVLIVAQSPLFISWHWNIPLTSIALLSAGTALLCALVLQRSAKNARTKALAELDRLLLPLAAQGADRKTRRSLRQMRSEIKDLNSGVFCSLTQNPVVYAILLPLAGGSGLAALEALLPRL